MGEQKEEKRIYVIVAETVQPEGSTDSYSIEQVPGRIAAQCAHVVSLLRVAMSERQEDFKEFGIYTPITTIILSAKSSKELFHIERILYRLGYGYQHFYDANEDVYGYNHETDAPYQVMTAVATFPVTQSEIDDVLGHLPLWSPKVAA